MEYHEEFVMDFAKRTMDNLVYIEKVQKAGGLDKPVHEFTQLANSMLGMLVFPREHYVDSIPDTPLTDLVKSGWPDIKAKEGGLNKDTLRELIRVLRNSIAHCNVKFLSDHDKQIRGVELWNTRGGKVTWRAELTVGELRELVHRFVELLTKEICEVNTRNDNP